MVAEELPDPPVPLNGPAARFYDELRRMLGALRPSGVDWAGLGVSYDDDAAGVQVRLPHVAEPGWTVWATADRAGAVVSIGAAHEHFDDHLGAGVDYVAEILCGEVEVATTYRGSWPLYADVRILAEEGRWRPLSRTGFVTPARLMVWRPKRVETVRPSFGAQRPG